MKVSVIFQDWLKECKNTLEKTTCEKYEFITYKHILPYWGECDHEKISRKTLIDFANYLQEKSVTKNQTDEALKIFSCCMHSASKHVIGLFDVIPTYRMRQKRQICKSIGSSDLHKIITATENSLCHWPVWLSAVTGMRRGEVLALKWENVDFTRNMIYVRESRAQTQSRQVYEKLPKTESSIRDIPITREQSYTLANLFESRNAKPKDHVCVNSQNNPLTPGSVSSMFWYCLRKRSDLPLIRFHDIRHAHATILLTEGRIDLQTVADRLGHKRNITTLTIYAHVTKQSQINIIKFMDSIHL